MKEYFEIGQLYDAEDVCAYAKFLYYNIDSNHEIYSLGTARLRFERTDKFDKLKYLGMFFRTTQEVEKGKK